MRWVITRVLPRPGPATMSNGPSMVSTASLWAGFSSARTSISSSNYFVPVSCHLISTCSGFTPVNIGSMSIEGKPLSGLPSQKVDVVLNVNANRITISKTGEATTIKLSPSNAIIVSTPNGITFTGVKQEQVEIKWQDTGTK